MAADLVARTAYQVGKTPLLPIYAALLGASDLVIGYVVSISTLTGLVLKPLVGTLSDRTNRRAWLILGLMIFAGVPFLYQFVTTAEQLYALRLLHGTATAIFGPVSLAYVAEMASNHRAERLGIFGMSRSASYLVAPVIGAGLLTILPPEQVFTLIGLVSCAALLPAIGLPEHTRARTRKQHPRAVLRALFASRALRLTAVLEMLVYVVTYALKAFLPIFALRAAGMDLILIGLFFTAQEATHLLVRPFAGRLADRVGTDRVILTGLIVLACGVSLLALSTDPMVWLSAAACIGAALGMILPATLSLLTAEVPQDMLGSGMGVLGASRNLAKALGPVLAGGMLLYLPYDTLFLLASALVASAAGLLGLNGATRPRVQGS